MTDGSPSAGAARARVRATLGDARTTPELERPEFAWVGPDARHGHVDDAALRRFFALRHAATALAGVGANDPALICRVLDAGAAGVIVALVEDAATAASLRARGASRIAVTADSGVLQLGSEAARAAPPGPS